MALRRLDGVDHVRVNLEGGSAEVLARPVEEGEASFDPRRIFRALERAGFTAAEVRLEVRGVFVRSPDAAATQEGWLLDTPGLSEPLALELGEGWSPERAPPEGGLLDVVGLLQSEPPHRLVPDLGLLDGGEVPGPVAP